MVWCGLGARYGCEVHVCAILVVCDKSQHFNIQPGFYEAEIQFGHFKYLLLSEAKIKWNEGGERILSKICQSYKKGFLHFSC